MKDKYMKMCELCNEKSLIEYRGYTVCQRCKVVIFTNKCKELTKIKKYLLEVNSSLKKQESFLHDIEQKQLFGEMLSQNEQEIYDNLSQYHKLQLGILHHINNSNCMKDECEFRMQLFSLLMLSDWLNEFLKLENNF